MISSRHAIHKLIQRYVVADARVVIILIFPIINKNISLIYSAIHSWKMEEINEINKWQYHQLFKTRKMKRKSGNKLQYNLQNGDLTIKVRTQLANRNETLVRRSGQQAEYNEKVLNELIKSHFDFRHFKSSYFKLSICLSLALTHTSMHVRRALNCTMNRNV